ncbi:hypothetical protein OpiT1DRAFT_04210 [Opitutaceae bacterium TAV1]|nr:hypothetical protein OpiT1DRAFT_04210 [Opitutaceae bacterium TAV1]
MTKKLLNLAAIFIGLVVVSNSSIARSSGSALSSQAGRWTWYTGEPIVLQNGSSGDGISATLEIRRLPPEHVLLRETLLIAQRRKLSATEQAYVTDAIARLASTTTATVIVVAGSDGEKTKVVRATAPDTGLPVLLRLPLTEDGTARIAPETLPPGTYEVRVPAVTGAPPVVRTLTLRTPLDHADFLMRGTDLFAALPNHRELFQMPAAGINTIQAHYRNAEGADSLAALGYEGVNCGIQPKADPSWAPVKPDGTSGGRQFYNVSFNNADSMRGMTDYIRGPGRAQLLHPFNSTSLTINEVADMVLIDYSPAARAGWTSYLEKTYKTIDALRADWGADADAGLASFEAVPMPEPPGGVGGSFNTHLMMDRDQQEQAKEASTTAQPDWLRAAWWHWLRFKDLSMRDWLAHAKHEYDQAGALLSGDKLIHPHHDPGITFRCNWFVLSQQGSRIFTYDSYNPTWRFGAYFADLASQLHSTPWVLETNKLGGPPAEAAAELYSLYAHGLTGVAFFKWQPYTEGPYYFGLLDPDWKPGEKFDAVARMYALAAQTAPSLLHLRTERSPVAVVYPHSDLVQNTARDWTLLRNWHAFYGAFTSRHLVPHILTEEFADQPVPDWIKVVVLADVNHVGPAVWANLRSWVREKGGALVIAGRTGEYDRYGKKSSVLSQYFEYETGEARLPRASITADSLSANVFRTGEWFVQNGVFKRTAPELLNVKPQGKAWTALRTVNMKNIALMKRALGKGRVVVVPWSPGAMFREESAAGDLRDFWFDLLAEEGIVSRLRVSPANTEIDAVLRTGDDERAVFVAGANHGKPERFTFSVPMPAGVPMRAFRLEGKTAKELALNSDPSGETASFELELGTFETFAVSLFPQESRATLLGIDGTPHAVRVQGSGLPWTVTVTDAQGLILSRPRHGVGTAEIAWPDYALTKRPVKIELTSPQGRSELILP